MDDSVFFIIFFLVILGCVPRIQNYLMEIFGAISIFMWINGPVHITKLEFLFSCTC